ncbi:MAG: HAD-IA family hydrolase [Candidatus Accumulibacter sp.]|uniref:HAD family hydrolase n=1 Tax=Accumulibacter sp. TaxID=2053492 RepID=UPI0019FBED41|nr:HAD-IA family hydrolase [Accumulibacter sp.]MBE2259440.1 HAD-IA family hydrolase [Paracoccaceae bacterium]MCB1943930.1 HAD-IA family hydrolase [Accumulibacter sp.]MCP5248540.1 HAD-IA family hydrolase [Accumulibacter sp.]
MAARFELLVFDWDGTLLDSAAAIVAAINAACDDLGLPAPGDERARHVIGLGLRDALRHAVPDLPEERYPQMVERYRHHYLAHDHELQLFDGAAALIGELAGAGFLLAVATGKSRLGLDRALRISGLGEHFRASRCADECFSKPHPQMLEELMDELAVAPGRTLMIGDTTHDLQMARNAGVASLAAAYGAHPPAELDALAPLALVHQIEEMARWLRTHA